jgi:hypothetical protein
MTEIRAQSIEYSHEPQVDHFLSCRSTDNPGC